MKREFIGQIQKSKDGRVLISKNHNYVMKFGENDSRIEETIRQAANLQMMSVESIYDIYMAVDETGKARMSFVLEGEEGQYDDLLPKKTSPKIVHAKQKLELDPMIYVRINTLADMVSQSFNEVHNSLLAAALENYSENGSIKGKLERYHA